MHRLDRLKGGRIVAFGDVWIKEDIQIGVV